MMDQFPFRNLVFQGGGVRTFVYHGALEVLEETDLLSQIDRVAGTSAGAMLAAVLSLRLSVADTLALYRTLDVSKVPQLASSDEMHLPEWLQSAGFVKSSLNLLAGNTSGVSRLVTKYGWYSTQYAYSWMQDVISDHCDGNGLATFADFRARGYRDLYVVTTNVSQHKQVVFSAEATPDVAVADALLMSQSIPLFFEAVRFDGHKLGDGDYFADGGMVNNYPLTLFDHERYVRNPRRFIAGVNWETLGCRHFVNPECDRSLRPVTNVLTYMENLAALIIKMQEMAFRQDPVNQKRTVNIDNLCVNTTDFSVTPDPDNETYRRMTAEGRRTMRAFLDGFKVPDSAESTPRTPQ